MLASVLAIIFLLLLIFVILLVLVGGLVIVFTVVLALLLTPIFTKKCIHVRLRVCVLNTVPLVRVIDASIKICMYSNMDTTTSANMCTHILILSLVLVLVSVTLSV